MFERNSDSLLSLPLAWLEISPVFTYPAVCLNASKLHEVHSPPVYFVIHPAFASPEQRPPTLTNS